MVKSRQSKKQSKAKGNSPRYWILFIIYLAFTFIVSYRLYDWAWAREITHLQNENTNHATLLASHLENKLQRGIIAASLNARSQILIDTIKNPTEQNVQLANHYLEHSNQVAASSVSYVMNAQGLTLAASNWRKGKNFVGKNYGFRPYFFNTIGGKASDYTALGVTSRILGYYYAVPITNTEAQNNRSEVIGVAVVKTNLASEKLLLTAPGTEIMVSDANGVIVLTTRKDWKLHSLASLDDQTMKNIIESRQYSGASLAPIELKQVENPAGLNNLVIIGKDTRVPGKNSETSPYLQSSVRLNNQNWTLHVFINTQEANQMAILTGLISILACTILFLLLRFFMGFRSNIEQLQEISIRDALTGLYTRRHMIDAGIAKIAASQTDLTHNFSIAMIDIDHFKSINDQFGHQCGDQVLQEVSKAIKACLHDEDLAVRFGGEEFVIIFSQESLQQDQDILQTMRLHIKRLHFPGKLKDVRLTISAGLAHYIRGESFDDILARADALLYEAKRQGRDRVRSED